MKENFESSKPNGKGNGGEDEGHDEYDNIIVATMTIGNHEMDCLERFKLSATSKGDKAEPDESKTSKLES
ncbi:hypothetical protein Gotri_024109 [Gossypium trilobum]|uniref:Uncharacterized protein n=1 Tax=Gossypium trilobum TaxID=34281 RepID=A0A7J9DLB6_9ROSI|nr:hypothetical protein [Gossypium trilobum]